MKTFKLFFFAKKNVIFLVFPIEETSHPVHPVSYFMWGGLSVTYGGRTKEQNQSVANNFSDEQLQILILFAKYIF